MGGSSIGGKIVQTQNSPHGEERKEEESVHLSLVSSEDEQELIRSVEDLSDGQVVQIGSRAFRILRQFSIYMLECTDEDCLGMTLLERQEAENGKSLGGKSFHQAYTAEDIDAEPSAENSFRVVQCKKCGKTALS